MKKTLLAFFTVVLVSNWVAAGDKGPRLRISLDEARYRLSEPIKLHVVFELGEGCWTINPNVSTLTLSIHVTDNSGREVRDRFPNTIYEYEIPRCNFATFCRVELITSYVYLCNRGRDMYAPYYELTPGRYHVKAVYDSGLLVSLMKGDEDEYCRSMASDRTVVKRLESNVVEFQVVGSSSQESMPQDEVRPTGSHSKRKNLDCSDPSGNAGVKLGGVPHKK